MNSRRKFLRNGGLAASVLLASKPFQLIAGTGNSFFKGSNSITLLHTGNSSPAQFSATASAALSVKKAGGNTLLLNAPCSAKNRTKFDAGTVKGYDALLAHHDDTADSAPVVLSTGSNATAEPVRIIYKGDIKIGVLGIAQPAGAAAFSEINRMAKTLKKDRNCNLVVCISSLGYENDNKTDDIHLAQSSAHLDVIISGNNTKNLSSTVVSNSMGGEVLIDNAGNPQTGIGKIEIRFNNRGEKNYVSFGNVSNSLS